MTLENFPTQEPSITLDFIKGRKIDPRISFQRDSIGTYQSKNTNIKTARSGGPRFEWVNGVCQGLLIEESRTNSITYSGDLGNTGTGGWYTNANKGGLNGSGGKNFFVTQSNTTDTLAPDGTYTATKLSPPSTIVAPQINPSISEMQYAIHLVSKVTAPAGVSSFYIKDPSNFADGLNKIGIMSGGLFNPAKGYASFDLVNNQVSTSNTASEAKIEDVGNGWYRISCVTGEGGSWGFNAWNALTSDLYIWGAQCESGGTFPTSYIPTSGSTVTRAADVAEMPAAYNVNQNTIINQDFGVAGGSHTLTIVGDGSKAERTFVYNSNLTQTEINAVAGVDDWWEWRVLGDSFGLPDFTTDGQVTVDWGDGTIEVLTTADHSFTNGGGYHVIKFRLDSGTYFSPFLGLGNSITHRTKVYSVGPTPNSMTINPNKCFYSCDNLEIIDSFLNTDGSAPNGIVNGCSSLKSFPMADFSTATSMGGGLGGGNRGGWKGCSSLQSFPAIDFPLIEDLWNGWRDCSSMKTFNATWTNAVTNMDGAFYNCSSLESFPYRPTENVTNFNLCWRNCSSLTSFASIDTSSATNFTTTWSNCSSLTSFPLIDTSNGTSFGSAWYNCNSLTSFPQLDLSNGESFYTHMGGGLGGCWYGCSSLVTFPAITFDSATTLRGAWRNCSSLQNFPANAFDNWTGTPLDGCFQVAWSGCSALTSTSVENILNSIDTSGQSAPASDVNIRIDYDTGTGTPNISTAVTNLKSRGWTITLNGVAQ